MNGVFHLISLVITDHAGAKFSSAQIFNQLGYGDVYIAVNGDIHPDCNLRFLGQYYDEESGLHYNRFRYYDPDTAQYISPDPIGLAGGDRPYGYVHNPLTWVDPLGLANYSASDPAKEATAWQGPGNDRFPGVDVYQNRTIKKGTILYALEPNGNQAPSYAVAYPTVRQNRGNPLGYHEALQVPAQSGGHPMRTQVRAYYVSQDIEVASGRALANPQYGEGGGFQFYIPESVRNVLRPGKVIDI